MEAKSPRATLFWVSFSISLVFMVQIQAQRTSTANPAFTSTGSSSGVAGNSDGGGRGTRFTTPVPGFGSNSTDISNSNTTSDPHLNVTVNNITQLQVLDENYLKVYLFPTETTLEIECHLNLSRWKQSAGAGGNSRTSSNNSNSKGEQKMIFYLGFERVEQDSLIDLVSVALDGENVGESSKGGSSRSSISSLKDSFWNPEAGTITQDAKQDYKLEYFNGNESKQFFSIKFTRQWLTCDGQDTQFTLAGMKMHWAIAPEEDESSDVEYGNVRINTTTTPAPNQSQNQRLTSTTSSRSSGSNPTGTTARSGTGRGTGTEATRSPLDSSSIAPTKEFGSSDENSKGTNSRMGTVTTKAPPPKVIKTFKDYKFMGPVSISLNDLFKNFTYLQIKGCGSIFTTIYQCSFPDYKNKAYLSSEESPFFIVKPIHQPNATEVGKSIQLDGRAYKPELCPSERFSFKGWKEGRARGRGLTGASTQMKNDAAVDAMKQSPLITNLIHFSAIVVYSSLFGRGLE